MDNAVGLAAHRTCVLGALSSEANYCSFLIIRHPLYIDYHAMLLTFIMWAQKKHNHAGETA